MRATGSTRRSGGLTNTKVFARGVDDTPAETLQWREDAPTEGKVVFFRDGPKREVTIETPEGIRPVNHVWCVHSPDGFEWGYGGSGPAECALNLLGFFVGPKDAWSLHQRFKSYFIAGVPRDGGHIDISTIREVTPAFYAEWLADQKR